MRIRRGPYGLFPQISGRQTKGRDAAARAPKVEQFTEVYGFVCTQCHAGDCLQLDDVDDYDAMMLLVMMIMILLCMFMWLAVGVQWAYQVAETCTVPTLAPSLHTVAVVLRMLMLTHDGDVVGDEQCSIHDDDA